LQARPGQASGHGAVSGAGESAGKRGAGGAGWDEDRAGRRPAGGHALESTGIEGEEDRAVTGDSRGRLVVRAARARNELADLAESQRLQRKLVKRLRPDADDLAGRKSLQPHMLRNVDLLRATTVPVPTATKRSLTR